MVRRLLLAGLGLTVIFFVDRLLKWYSLNHLPEEGVALIPGVVRLTTATNAGLIYGLSVSPASAIGIMGGAMLALVMIGAHAWRRQRTGQLIGVAAMLTGSFSNLFDRLSAGYVVDYLVSITPSVFNLADVLIAVGAVMWVIALLRQRAS